MISNREAIPIMRMREAFSITALLSVVFFQVVVVVEGKHETQVITTCIKCF